MKARDKQGRKIRRDAQLMLAGVVSFPADSDASFSAFISKSISFLRRKYGSTLHSVVLHTDEAHPHLHFYCVPNLTKQNQFHISEVHEGIRARQKCGGGYSKKTHAYKAAMRKFQDEYFDQVASQLGMCRLGPRVQRLTRKEWKAQQKAAEALSQKKLELMRVEKKNRKIELDQHELTQQLNEQESELIALAKKSLFGNKKDRKIIYLRNLLKKARQQQLYDKQEALELENYLKEARTSIKVLERSNQSYQHKFEAMSYKLKLKDQRIRQLKFNNMDNNNEKKHLSNTSNHFSY